MAVFGGFETAFVYRYYNPILQRLCVYSPSVGNFHQLRLVV